jgi:hypothetical protein
MQVSPAFTVTTIGGSGVKVIVGANVSVGPRVSVIVEVAAGAVFAAGSAAQGPLVSPIMISAPRINVMMGPAITKPMGRLMLADVPLIRAGARTVLAFPAPASKTIPHTAHRVAVSAIRVPQAGHIRLGVVGLGLVFDIYSPFGVR